MEIGSIIMKKRKELGITQQVLAKKLHVSNQAVSKWENGMTCPEISLLPAIAKVFGSECGFSSWISVSNIERL